MPAVTLFRDRGIPTQDTPWQDIPLGADAITKAGCGAYPELFPRGAVTTAGDTQPEFMPLPPNAIIRAVGPTDQEPFGHKHFAVQGAHLAINRDDLTRHIPEDAHD